jgi:hypothetical protein
VLTYHSVGFIPSPLHYQQTSLPSFIPFVTYIISACPKAWLAFLLVEVAQAVAKLRKRHELVPSDSELFH